MHIFSFVILQRTNPKRKIQFEATIQNGVLHYSDTERCTQVYLIFIIVLYTHQ